MNHDKSSAFGKVLLGFASIALIVAVFAATFERSRQRDLRPSDDNIWFYMTGAELRNPARAEAVRKIVLDEVTPRAASEEGAKRFIMRVEYKENYYAHSVLLGLVNPPAGEAARSGVLPYADAISEGTLKVTAAAAIISLILLIAGLAVTRRVYFLTAAAFAMVVLAVAPRFSSAGNFILFESLDPSVFSGNLVRFLINPGEQFLIFGFTPRNYLFLLTLVVFAWRWAGMWAASYWFAAALLIVHLSLGALFIAILVAIDLLLRREQFLRLHIVAPLAFAAVFWASRESLWEYLNPSLKAVMPVIVGLFAVVALIGFQILGRRLRNHPLMTGVPKWLQPLQKRPAYQSDALIISVGWLVLLPITYAISASMDPVVAKYFWAQLNARLYALLYPAIVFAIMLWAIQKYSPKLDQRPWLTPLACGAIALAFILQAPRESEPYSNFREGMRGVAQASLNPISGPITIGDEAVIYFAASRQIEGDVPALTDVLSGAKAPATTESK